MFPTCAANGSRLMAHIAQNTLTPMTMMTKSTIPSLLVVLYLSGCSSAPKAEEAGNPGETLLFSHPGDTIPDWVSNQGASDTDKVRHFTGISRMFATERDARTNALEDARTRIAEYLGTDVKRLVREVTAYVGASSDIQDPGSVSDAATRLASEASVLGTAGRTFYSQRWRRPDGQTYWKVYVSVPFQRGQEYDLAINDLKSQLEREKDQKKQRNIEAAINRLEELKKQGFFEK